MGSNHHYQGFENNNSEIYNTMEMIGFPHNQTVRAGPGGPSSSKSIIGQHTQHTHDYYHHDQPWLVEDQSLRCVFPSEGNEKPSQGLSLSLSSSNPSTMGFQSFELRQRQINEDMGFVPSSSRINGYFSKPLNIQPQEQIFEGENIQYSQDQFFMRNSKYIGAVQELLNEFCSLGIKENDHDSSKIKLQKGNILEENVSSSSKKQALYSLDLLELQKKKTKLLHLLEELDRRYKHYCEQMKTMKSSFEVIAGNGASKVYTTLASKAMSKHFRCLRDSIVEQIKIVKKGMGEKDSSSIGIPGTTKGETPRLRVLDQSLRQQRAFQQMTMMETHPWRPQRGLPERSVSVLRAWLFEHFLHPYPSDVDKHILARQTGLSRSQVSNWFINARVRLWKPMVEEMYVEELKEQEGNNSNNGDDHDNHNENLQLGIEDEKPTHDQLIRIDSECLSSVVNNQEKNDVRNRVSGFSSGGELDFSSYNHNSTSGVFGHENAFHGFGDVGGGNVGGGGGVSLTLGLQQHGETGVSLAFSSASQSSLFYPRDQEYSLLDNEGQNLPYRNLMGAQLLHDLTR